MRRKTGSFLDYMQEGDLYLLKHILHDWRDEQAARILEKCQNQWDQEHEYC